MPPHSVSDSFNDSLVSSLHKRSRPERWQPPHRKQSKAADFRYLRSEELPAVPCLLDSQSVGFLLQPVHNRIQCIPDAGNQPAYRSLPDLQSTQSYAQLRLSSLHKPHTYASDRFHPTSTRRHRNEELSQRLPKPLSGSAPSCW